MDIIAIRGKERNSNIELLRIISMLMVLVLHCLSATGALEYISGAQFYIYWGMEAACIIAVNVFVLISGYFMIESSFKAHKVLKIGGEVWIYSVIFSVVDLCASGQGWSGSYLLKMLFPLLTKRYWFVNSYLMIYLLSPFLNKLIHSLSKKKFQILLFYLILLFSVRVTFLPSRWSQDLSSGMGVLWFGVLYCIAAWIRLYYKPDREWKKWLYTYLGIMVFLVVSKRAMGYVGIGSEFSAKLYNYSSAFVLAEALALFLFFLNCKSFTGKMGIWINSIARHSFSVYIIHFTITSVLWTRILHVDRWIGNVLSGAFAILLAIVVVFAFCVVVDYVKEIIRARIFLVFQNTKFTRKITRILDKWDSLVSKEET